MKTRAKLKSKLCMIVCGAAMLALTTGCSKDNPLNPAGNCFGGMWAQEYADELEAWSNAATAYNENPTASNCTSYKNAAKAYLDVLEDVYKCVPTANRAEIKQGIDEAKAEIDKDGCD